MAIIKINTDLLSTQLLNNIFSDSDINFPELMHNLKFDIFEGKSVKAIPYEKELTKSFVFTELYCGHYYIFDNNNKKIYKSVNLDKELNMQWELNENTQIINRNFDNYDFYRNLYKIKITHKIKGHPGMFIVKFVVLSDYERNNLRFKLAINTLKGENSININSKGNHMATLIRTSDIPIMERIDFVIDFYKISKCGPEIKDSIIILFRSYLHQLTSDVDFDVEETYERILKIHKFVNRPIIFSYINLLMQSDNPKRNELILKFISQEQFDLMRKYPSVMEMYEYFYKDFKNLRYPLSTIRNNIMGNIVRNRYGSDIEEQDLEKFNKIFREILKNNFYSDYGFSFFYQLNEYCKSLGINDFPEIAVESIDTLLSTDRFTLENCFNSFERFKDSIDYSKSQKIKRFIMNRKI